MRLRTSDIGGFVKFILCFSVHFYFENKRVGLGSDRLVPVDVLGIHCFPQTFAGSASQFSFTEQYWD